jgi:hypothetical protein
MVPPPQWAPAAEGVVGALPLRGAVSPVSIDNAGIAAEAAKRRSAGPAWRPPFPSPGEDGGRSGLSVGGLVGGFRVAHARVQA